MVREVDLSQYRSTFGCGHKLRRLVWAWAWMLLFRPTPRLFHWWRVFILRVFGARLGRGCHVYPACRIWAPWNLEMGDHSCLGSGVECYNVARLFVGSHVTVSQYAFLCTASHDLTDTHMALIINSVRINDAAWIAARAFISPGVTVGEGAVVGACAVVTRDVDPWTVVVGNPARFIKERILRKDYAK